MSETVKVHEALEATIAEDPQVWIQKVFVYFLMSLFRHEDFRGTGMLWSRDNESTELIITTEKPRLEVAEKLPHIVVIPGPMQWANLGLDQLQSKSMATGERTHTDLVSQTVAFHCQAKGGNHARRLAWYASQYTIMFRRMIMRHGRLHHISPNVSISAETAPTAILGSPRSSEELVSVVVHIPFFWQPSWKIRDPAPLMNKIGVSLGVRKPTTPLQFGGKPIYRTIPIEEYTETEVTLTQEVEVDSNS